MTGERTVFGLDQAAKTGWGIARERGAVQHYGLATTHVDRMDAVKLAIERAGDPRALWVVFEKHDHMPPTRLGPHDRTTQRKGPRQGAPERSNQTLIGMGKAYGRWLELLDMLGVPQAHVLEVRPTSWRARIHGVTRGDEARIKGAALDWASKHLGLSLTDHNVAEGVCITAWGAVDGLATYDAAKATSRIAALAKRQAGRQLQLGERPKLLGGPLQ